MKKLIILAAVSLIAASAFAQMDPDPDGIGVYFEPGALTNEATWVPFTQNHAYVCVTRPVSGVGAVEFGYHLAAAPGSVVRTGEGYPANSVEASGNHGMPTDGEYITGFGNPLPAMGSVVVMDWTFMPFGAGAIDFYITGTSVPGLPGGEPAYVAAIPGLPMVKLQQSTGGPLIPVATVNNIPAPVEVESASFGNVKSLFR